MQKLNSGIIIEIAVESNQAGAARNSERGKIGVSPSAAAQIKPAGPPFQQFVKSGRLAEQGNLGQGQPRAKRTPGPPRRPGSLRPESSNS